jgi:hypothetical protein
MNALQSPPADRRVGPRVRLFFWGALAVAVVGEGGHRLFDQYGTAVGHHLFHILMVGGAALLFFAIAVYDIRRNGRPRFSWRLSSSR